MTVAYHLTINPGSRNLTTVKTEVGYIKSPQENKQINLSLIKEFIKTKNLDVVLALYCWSTFGFDLNPGIHPDQEYSFEEIRRIENMFPTNIVLRVYLFTPPYLKERGMSKDELIIHFEDCYMKELLI